MNKTIIATTLFTLLALVSCDKNSSISSNKKEMSKNSKEENHNHVESYYTCSMHPQVKSDKPGKCPICHMNLSKVEIEKEDEADMLEMKKKAKVFYACKNFPDVTSEVLSDCPLDGTQMIKIKAANKIKEVIAKVKLRKAHMKHFEPAIFPVTQMKMRKNIQLLGNVLQSEEKQSKIPARTSGRVEKVYISTTGAYVRKGDPVIDLYSPTLITGGEEYLIAHKNYKKSKAKEDYELLKQSEERLLLWGLKKSQLNSWVKSNSVPRSITIYSSATGIVQKRNAVSGKYFKEGQNFFELSDLSSLWVEMDVYEFDSALVKLGQSVSLSFVALPGEIKNGNLDFISPVLNEKSRTLKVRATIENKLGKLKPGMAAFGTLFYEFPGLPIVVPRTAIIDTGKRKVVWLKNSKRSFHGVLVETGFESEGYVEIKKGLKVDDEVVIEGNFLLDAQAQLFGGYEDVKDDSPSKHQH